MSQKCKYISFLKLFSLGIRERMTTATSTRGKTEFMVSQHTSSKELFDQLNELKADKGADADLPIRAYDKGRKGITLKIYNKKTSGAGIVKAAANPQRVSARLLVITTIESILESESKKSTNEDKEKINQVLGNIKAKKSRCIKHDIKIPDLISDLNDLKPIWDKSSANSKPTLSPSHTTTPLPQKTESTKKLHEEKTKLSKVRTKINPHTTAEITPAQNKSSTSTVKKPNLKIREAEFDLSKAIEFLNDVKSYGKKFDSESNVKARIRVGEIKDADELSFYVSTKDNKKAKKTDRAKEGRKAENKTTTTNRAITMLRSIADSLAGQNRLSTEEVNKVFSAIEKQGYISVNDASSLLDLLETGRRAVYVLPVVVQADSNGTPDTPSILNINSNPFEYVTSQENNVTITPSSSQTSSATIIQASHAEPSTNPFDDVSTIEQQTPTPAPPSFLQRAADFFKPVTNFFASVRRFFGFN